MQYKYRHTIFTPIFNRAYMIDDVFTSIKELDYNRDKFEWLIVDDGSTDNLEEKVNSIISRKEDINIRYLYKKNGGIHTAMNYAINNANGEFVTRIDSDDVLLPDALRNKDKALDTIPSDKYKHYIGVVGLCLNKSDMSIRGDKFPMDVMDITGSELHRKFKIKGDRNFCMKTEIMRQYLIPEYTDTKWVPEGIIWRRIDRKYITRFVNVGLSVCAEPNDDSVSGQISATIMSPGACLSRFYGSLYMVNESSDLISFYEYIGRLGIVLVMGGISKKYDFKDTILLLNTKKSRALALLLAPLAYIYIFLYNIRSKKNLECKGKSSEN